MDCCVNIHLVWTLNFTELECGLLCLLALSVHFEIYRTFKLTEVRVDCCVNRHIVWTEWRVDCCVYRHIVWTEWRVDCCVYRHLVWTLKFTEVESGLLCSQAFSVD